MDMRVPSIQIIGFYDDADNFSFLATTNILMMACRSERVFHPWHITSAKGSLFQDDSLLKPLVGCGFLLWMLRSRTKLDSLDDCV